jgi:hypothetical protein
MEPRILYLDRLGRWPFLRRTPGHGRPRETRRELSPKVGEGRDQVEALKLVASGRGCGLENLDDIRCIPFGTAMPKGAFVTMSMPISFRVGTVNSATAVQRDLIALRTILSVVPAPISSSLRRNPQIASRGQLKSSQIDFDSPWVFASHCPTMSLTRPIVFWLD